MNSFEPFLESLQKNNVKQTLKITVYFLLFFQIFKDIMVAHGKKESLIVDLDKCSAYKTMYYNKSDRVNMSLFLSSLLTLLPLLWL